MDARRRYEEMGSSSYHHQNMAAGGSSSSSSRGSPDSPNGLKFGQKIYFGDVGFGALGVCHGGSSTSVTSPTAAAARGGRRGRGVAQSGQPPRCQVEGCWVDLSDAKAYYSRHKVCCMHSKSAKVTVGGIEQRFCQQCSRFHQLAEFDHGKRSCRRRLAGHNERRRKPPTGPLLSSRLGRLSSSIFGVGGGGRTGSGGGYLVDFGSGLKEPGRDLWPGTKISSHHSINPASMDHHQGKPFQGSGPPAAMWHGNSSSGATNNTQPGEMFLQQQGPPGNRSAGFLHASGGTHAPVPSGECYAPGVVVSSYDSSCALSLLSSQHWSSANNRAPSNQSVNYLNSDGSSSMGHNTTGLHHDVGLAHYSTGAWHSKGEDGGMQAYLGLGQVSLSLPSRFGGGDGFAMDPHHGQAGGGGRSFMEAEHHSKTYGSSAAEYVNWSL